jgi:hypothetical protein
MRPTGRGAPAASRLGAYAPVPLVGAASILVALIIFTPVLLASGPSPLAVQAELTIYRVVGGSTTQFYVRAVGSEVAYSEIRLAVGSGFAWSGSCPTSGVSWSYSNGTDLLEENAMTGSTVVVLNATAVYNPSGTMTIYAGELALEIVGLGTPGEALSIVPCTSVTPGMSAPGSWATANLPLSLDLVDYGSGGPP